MIKRSAIYVAMNNALRDVKSDLTFPFRTGNLKFNATYGVVNDNSFSIVFDGTIAPYIPFLEYGTIKSQKHVGFISVRARNQVIMSLSKTFNRKVVRYKVENKIDWSNNND